MKKIRIGNAAGFWGDQTTAPRRLVEQGNLDYLTLEYLAELTMSILAHLKSRNPEAGYVTDFPEAVADLVNSLRDQPNLRIVTNAGGMNPGGCARAVSRILSDAGLNDVKVAAVTGDDLFADIETHQNGGEAFAHFDTQKPFGDVANRIVSANAYMGAAGIVQALEAGARIVITGRVADASLAVGPAIHELGWAWEDYDKLAAATVAGHIIECGAQSTGGIYSDWSPELSMADVGYPIAEIDADGGVLITKPESTGGVVNEATVAEQIVYEIGDPAKYFTPDVVADFTQVELAEVAADCVSVTGARGLPAPENYKVSMAYRDGYWVSGTLVIVGPNAAARAKVSGQMILDRVERAGYKLQRSNIECLGAGDVVSGCYPQNQNLSEVVLRVTAHDPSKEAVEQLAREFAPLVTSGLPGTTGYTGGRPKPRPVLSYWPSLIGRGRLQSTATVCTATDWLVTEGGK